MCVGNDKAAFLGPFYLRESIRLDRNTKTMAKTSFHWVGFGDF